MESWTLKSSEKLYTHLVQLGRHRLESFVPEELRQGRVLDIGCGTGGAVVAASCLGAAMSVGIDIDLGVFAHEVDLAEFPAVCARFGGSPERCMLIEADVFDVRFGTPFDCCIMLDTIEHVPDPARFISYAYDAVRPGGALLVDCGALYLSPIGHHLFTYWPFEEAPWVHLWSDFDERYAARGVDPWSEKYWLELNRVTHDEIIQAMNKAGFEITFEHRGVKEGRKAELFDAFRDRLRPEHRDDPRLFEDWIVAVGRK